MKALALLAEDLYSYEKIDLDLSKYHHGTTMILGKNLDMNSANGAGKSAILKLIYLALFGSEIKGVAYEKIVREGSTGGSLVAYSFEDRGSIYRIVRWKKYKKATSSVTLSSGKIPSGDGFEFTIDGKEPFKVDKDTSLNETALEEKLGMNGKIFLNSILTQQKKEDNFLLATDGKKKDLLSELFDLEFYEKALKLVKADITSLETLIEVNKNKDELYTKQHESETENLKSLEARINQEIASRQNRTAELTKLIFGLNQEVASLEKESAELEEVNFSDLEKDLREAQAQKNSLEQDAALESELIKQKNTAEQTLKSLDELEVRINKELKDISDKSLVLATQLKELAIPGNLEEKEIQLKLKQKEAQDLNLKIQNLKKTLEKENLLVKEKTTLENQLGQLNEKIHSIRLSIKNIEHELKCDACKRPFKEGESELLDQMLEAKRKEESIALADVLAKETLLQGAVEELGILELSKQEFKKEELSLKTQLEELSNLKVSFEKDISLLKQGEIIKKQIQDFLERESKNTTDLEKIAQKRKVIHVNLEELIPLEAELKIIKARLAAETLKVSELDFKFKELQLKNSNTINAKKNLSDKKNNLESFKKELSSLQGTDNPLDEVIAKTKANLKNLDIDLAETKKKLTAAYEKIKYLNFWQAGFAKTGIRSFILDDVINLLNFKTKENLDVLSDRSLSLLFQPEKKSGKGITSNKITTLMYVNGVERVFDLNSGGEAQRLTLAVDLALSEIAEARVGTHFNMKFLDEPFDGIDTNGQIKALALFNRLAQSRNGFFIISHDKEMQAFCDNTIYVLKENGTSRLVNKDEFMAADSLGGAQ